MWKQRKTQIKTPATDLKPWAGRAVGSRQEIVRVNNGIDNHTLLTQTDWKLKHRPQRKICKGTRACSGVLYSQALVLALAGPFRERQVERTQNAFVMSAPLKKVVVDEGPI